MNQTIPSSIKKRVAVNEVMTKAHDKNEKMKKVNEDRHLFKRLKPNSVATQFSEPVVYADELRLEDDKPLGLTFRDSFLKSFSASVK